MSDNLTTLSKLLAAGAGFDIRQWKDGKCIRCGLEAEPRCRTGAGLKEFNLSGLCEVCFDEICDEDTVLEGDKCTR